MKKIIWILISVLTMAALLVGCGQPAAENEAETSSAMYTDGNIWLAISDGGYSYFLQESGDRGSEDYIMSVENKPGAIPTPVVHTSLLQGDGMSHFSYYLCGVQNEKLYYIEFASEEQFLDTSIVKWTNRDGSQGGEVCRFPTEALGGGAFRNFIAGSRLYLDNFIVVDLEAGTWDLAELPPYSDFASLSEEELQTGVFQYRNIGVMDGQLVCVYALPSQVNRSEVELRVCLQDGEKETVVFREIMGIKDYRNSIDSIFATLVTDFGNRRLYYFDDRSHCINRIELKTGEMQQVQSFGEDVSGEDVLYIVSGGYLYTMEPGTLHQIDLNTLEEKQYKLPASAESYHSYDEFLLAPCDNGGCWIYRHVTSMMRDAVRFLPDQTENGGFTLYESMN